MEEKDLDFQFWFWLAPVGCLLKKEKVKIDTKRQAVL